MEKPYRSFFSTNNNTESGGMTPELHIEPLATIGDLILSIGLIGLGLSILAVIITVEIYYFRGGAKK